tara:strand:- start:32391 stop:33422 length:1032 start_codon:yes stop_codon:yes gene_type:complete
MPQENNFNLSIIIPVYNEENYLNELFNQLIAYFNNDDVEVIFVNDGSTDNSKSLIENFKNTKDHKFTYKYTTLDNNSGKGRAIQEGINISTGKYILLQDADLELDTKDAFEMYKMIQSKEEIKCIFGSRYLSGKLKRNNYFFNNLVGKLNSLIFTIFFMHSLTDVHCGLKIMHREVINKINLTVNDFGIELDIASQIVRNNFFIHEYGVSYFFRTKLQGKKITWIDGLKSLYYLFKVRFIDNEKFTNISLIFSTIYMAYVGSHFGMGTGNILFIILFSIIGSIIGFNFYFFTSSLIFLFIYIGSLFGEIHTKTLSVLIFFIIGIIIARYVKKKFLNSKLSKLI